MVKPTELQRELRGLLEDVCAKYGYPKARAPYMVRELLGCFYIPEIELPSVAPALWSQRSGEDSDLNPIQFYDKY